MSSRRDIAVNHNIEMYSTEMMYYKENKLMARKYFDYISEYCTNYNNFLELGVGFGDTIQLINDNFSNVIVLDAEEKLVDKYRNNYANITFIHTYFEDFKTTHKFNNIGMGFVIDLVENPVILLKKYAELLTENGRIFLSIQSASSLHRRIAYDAGLLDDIKKMTPYDEMYNHKFYNTFDELIALFNESGLKIVASHGLFLKAFSTAQIESLKLDDSIYKALAETARDLPEISSACFFVLSR